MKSFLIPIIVPMTRHDKSCFVPQPGAALLGQSWPLRDDVHEVSVS